jgi:outer membrane protein assembly factor BamB
VAIALVAGCSKREVILDGQRHDINTPLEQTVPGAEVPADEQAAADQRSRAIRLPATVNHSSWTHAGGSPQHRIQHPALRRPLTLAVATPIGASNSKRHRITAVPVSADGRIFTMDSRATVSAHTLDGTTIWSRSLVPPSDDPDDASGGGLAVAGGVLYATSSFGTLTALDVATGREIWQHDFNVAVTGAPTISGNLVYVVARDGDGWALETRNGRILWGLPGTPSLSGFAGGASPAISDRLVLFPLPTGELVGALKQSGVRVWGDAVSGSRDGRAYTGFSDITGEPVVAGNTVYVATPVGRLVALNGRSGERLWTATEGAVDTVWPIGGSIFLLSDQNKLVRVDASNGESIWEVDLPFFAEEKKRKQKALVPHFGPVVAGGRVIVASGDGLLRGFNPENGQLVESVQIPSGAAVKPIVVRGTLYVVSNDGQLLGFR